MNLPDSSRSALAVALARQPHVRRAIVVPTSGEKPVIAFEYDERPASVEAARSQLERLVAAVTPALGAFAYRCGFSAGGPEEIARLAAQGEVIYERP